MNTKYIARVSCHICTGSHLLEDDYDVSVDNMCILPLIRLDPCRHNFCAPCIYKLMNVNTQRLSEIKCPTCRQSSKKGTIFSVNMQDYVTIDIDLKNIKNVIIPLDPKFNTALIARQLFDKNIIDSNNNNTKKNEFKSQTINSLTSEIIKHKLELTKIKESIETEKKKKLKARQQYDFVFKRLAMEKFQLCKSKEEEFKKLETKIAAMKKEMNVLQSYKKFMKEEITDLQHKVMIQKDMLKYQTDLNLRITRANIALSGRAASNEPSTSK
ncbi:cg30 [Cryptophlebia peltastica nucleopolyhedrovirus]|uniref:Cg30 n=1 Tax=Cryptophlebia peltastica nucleopolyhedrovirus TaxID=2304025 RepID=A0A346RNT6_9ABAC|nr:cg30 [Cryptophlebia peltastica nucleopolyhedrovirus]AXS67733.1 cg30 [Cryptophlebia peltastica nucleopolyhedrovirus]